MGESTKAVCGLLMIVGVIAAWLAWTADRPDATTWGFRIGGPIMAILALGLFLKLQFRADLEHDYLRPLTGTYFNRDGFCFAFVVTAVDGIAFMYAYFQTQYDRPSLGRIALRPAASGFFMTRAKIDSITFEIECPPAGFGYARIAIPIPEKRQGKRQSFEVGASVRYPEGKGRRIRFHDGLLCSNANFGNSFGTALTVVGAATGSIVLSKPATVTIDLPAGVTEDIPDDLASETKILWQMGEPALENVV